MKVYKILLFFIVLLSVSCPLRAEQPKWALNAVKYFSRMGMTENSIQKEHPYYGEMIYTKLGKTKAMFVFKDNDPKKINEFCAYYLKGWFFIIYKRAIIAQTIVIPHDMTEDAKVLYPILEKDL